MLLSFGICIALILANRRCQLEAQRDLLAQLKKVLGNPTYKMISERTGIQVTRVFRIFNGIEMKFSEYLTIKELLDSEMKKDTNFEKLIRDCKSKLRVSTLVEIEKLCVRKLEIVKLATEVEKVEVA